MTEKDYEFAVPDFACMYLLFFYEDNMGLQYLTLHICIFYFFYEGGEVETTCQPFCQ